MISELRQALLALARLSDQYADCNVACSNGPAEAIDLFHMNRVGHRWTAGMCDGCFVSRFAITYIPEYKAGRCADDP